MLNRIIDFVMINRITDFWHRHPTLCVMIAFFAFTALLLWAGAEHLDARFYQWLGQAK